MKKLLSILLTLCILLVAFSGCAKGAKEVEDVAAPQNEEAQPQSTASDEPSSSESDKKPSLGASQQTFDSPSAAYAKYMEVKGLSYDRISAKIQENDELAMSLGMALLPIAMVDLSLIPLTIVGVEGGEAALGILGLQGVDVKQNGSVYTVTYKDEEGKTFELTCDYDKATDSMQSEIMQDGEEAIFFEYVNTGKGYASQYHTANTDGSGYTLMTCFFDGSNFASGMVTADKKPDSIFRNKNLTADFVKNDETYFILDGDQLTVLSEGETNTY